MATLLIVEGPAAGKHFALDRHRLVLVGREESCTFQVLDEHVSRRHLRVKAIDEGGTHAAIDAGSANGVLINEVKLDPDKELPLKDGDKIEIGNTKIVYTTEDFENAEQAMRGIRMHGERRRSTIVPK